MEHLKYDILTSIPLLQGVMGTDLNRILDMQCLKQKNLLAGETILRHGQRYDELAILLKGEMTVVSSSPDNDYTLTETFLPPHIIEPDVLYGVQRTLCGTYRAKSSCEMIFISKSDVDHLMSRIEVFRINMMNTLCSLASRRRRTMWLLPTPQLSQRIGQFVRNICLVPRGEKILNMRMCDLGARMGATRALIGSTLHEMQENNLLSYKRREIVIQNIENL